MNCKALHPTKSSGCIYKIKHLDWKGHRPGAYFFLMIEHSNELQMHDGWIGSVRHARVFNTIKSSSDPWAGKFTRDLRNFEWPNKKKRFHVLDLPTSSQVCPSFAWTKF